MSLQPTAPSTSETENDITGLTAGSSVLLIPSLSEKSKESKITREVDINLPVPKFLLASASQGGRCDNTPNPESDHLPSDPLPYTADPPVQPNSGLSNTLTEPQVPDILKSKIRNMPQQFEKEFNLKIYLA